MTLFPYRIGVLPKVVIETERDVILIKSYDNVNVVIKSTLAVDV